MIMVIKKEVFAQYKYLFVKITRNYQNLFLTFDDSQNVRLFYPLQFLIVQDVAEKQF